MKPHIIGIAGPSSSGKTELARQLSRKLPGASIVSLDSYYRGMEEISLEARKKVNFDHPDALEWPLLHKHLQAMAAGLRSTSRCIPSPSMRVPARPGASTLAI